MRRQHVLPRKECGDASVSDLGIVPFTFVGLSMTVLYHYHHYHHHQCDQQSSHAVARCLLLRLGFFLCFTTVRNFFAMSKKPSKVQASSGRIAIGNPSLAFGSGSPLSYLAEQPDLSGLSDPNVVVNFKNLSKKDSTTKSKALEDLQSYADSHLQRGDDVEDAFLQAWVGASRLPSL